MNDGAKRALFLPIVNIDCVKSLMIDLKLVNHTSMLIGTQSRRPCRDVQLGEAVLLNNPVSPQEQVIFCG
jgi:hypothetical protein